MDRLRLLGTNTAVFAGSFLLAYKFAVGSLFEASELKEGQRYQLAVFSGTFGLCSLMLAYFLQDVWGLHDS